MVAGVDDRKAIQSIQHWRGIAALLVATFHIFFRLDRPEAFYVGACGVDIFFVISGFLMLVLTADARLTPQAFFVQRLQRIVPLYWLVTTLYVVIGLARPALYPWPAVDLREYALSMLFLPYAAQTGDIVPIVAPGWTLNMEMFFYAVFTVALFIGRRHRLLIAAALLASIVLAGAALGTNAPVALRFYSNTIVLEFIAGMALGTWWLGGRLPGVSVGVALMLASAAWLTLSFAMHLDIVDYPRAILWGVPAVGLVAGGIMVERGGRWPNWSWLRICGDASYSLYLLHTLVLAVVYKVAGTLPVPIFVAIALAAIVLVAVLSYRFVERPIHKAFGRWRKTPATR